jgi:hypothetical protein
VVAPFFGSRETEVFAQCVEERRADVEGNETLTAVTRSASPIGALTFRGSCASTAFAEAARATAGRAADDAVAMRKLRRLALPAAGLDALGMTFSRGSDRRARHGSQSPRGLPRFNKSLDSGFREHRHECGKGRRKAFATHRWQLRGIRG